MRKIIIRISIGALLLLVAGFCLYHWADVSSIRRADYAYIKQTENILATGEDDLFYLRSSKDEGFGVDLSKIPHAIRIGNTTYILFFSSLTKISVSWLPSSHKYQFYSFDQERFGDVFPDIKNYCNVFRVTSDDYNYAKMQLAGMLDQDLFSSNFEQRNLSDDPVRVCGKKKGDK